MTNRIELSRRGLIALGGAGLAAGLAACGTELEPREEGRDPELISAALAAERAVVDAARGAITVGQERRFATVVADAAEARARTLSRLAAEAGAEAEAADGEPTLGEGLGSLTAPLERAIGLYRDGAGLLSTAELRATAFEFLARTAGELAGLRGLLGEDQAPRAFVTGGDAEPFVAAAEADEEGAE